MKNLIRPIAVGRRTLSFAGSHEGRNAAIFYSLFACCKLNGVDPVQC
ncbi:MAG: hypothetical protein IPJ40_24380 [Saprospirales bacterium]|nr:hypothetical protein [Saprospirales bacterium]